MPYQAAAENSRDIVALQHDGDAAPTQPLKDKDDNKVLCNPLCEFSSTPTKAE